MEGEKCIYAFVVFPLFLFPLFIYIYVYTQEREKKVIKKFLFFPCLFFSIFFYLKDRFTLNMANKEFVTRLYKPFFITVPLVLFIKIPG